MVGSKVPSGAANILFTHERRSRPEGLKVVVGHREMTICQNGEKTKDFGMQNEYFEKKADLPPVTYGKFYGGDMGEIIFDTGNTEKDSILVLGESYDNAILKLLASHFDKTYSVDMRFYKAYMGNDFNISEFVKEHSIDTVLFIGNIDFFINEEFIPEY